MKFDDGMPKGCPPNDAELAPVVIFRALEQEKISDGDVVSWVMGNHPSAKRDNCRHWGLSCWMSVEAVQHARKTYPSLKDKVIAMGNMLAGDGKVKSTPSKPQPLHCTFWYNTLVDLKPRFSDFMGPEK